MFLPTATAAVVFAPPPPPQLSPANDNGNPNKRWIIHGNIFPVVTSQKNWEDVDPFKLASKDLSPFTDTIKELVESEHPVLSMAAKHFFEKRHGKRFRPTIVALMGKKNRGFFFLLLRFAFILPC